MPTNLPLLTVIAQVIAHTPLWVWAILALITALGLRQAREFEVPLRRLVIVPIALGAYSLWGTVGIAGAHASVLACWAAGWLLVAGAYVSLAGTSRAIALPNGRFRMPGSLTPLFTMWGVFGVRYVATVMLIMHPEVARSEWFGVVTPLVYGALSGLFAGRALHTLRGGRPAATLAVA